jgi:phenylalanyl-tRNA synthetase beta chain
MIAGLGENIKDFPLVKTFEFEKIFNIWKNNEVIENYSLAWMVVENKDLVYYDIQNIVSDFFKQVWVDNFSFDILENIPEYAHSGRVAKIIVRGKEVWIIGEIHPTIAKRFDIEKSRIAFFEINIDAILWAVYKIVKAKEISIYQENNFDLSFLVDQKTKWADIKQAIVNTDKKIIDRVELFDIYENQEKIPGKRSLSFKVFISSLDWTLDDKVKNELIENIVKKVEKKGGELR